jgi:hypothetical protein
VLHEQISVLHRPLEIWSEHWLSGPAASTLDVRDGSNPDEKR